MGFHYVPSGGTSYPPVDTYADLPSASENLDAVYLVRNATGVMFVNRKDSGLYRSDGSSWYKLGDIILTIGGQEGILVSNAPSGKCHIVNLYYDQVTEKVKIEYENIPEP